jgi:hypothetical protein
MKGATALLELERQGETAAREINFTRGQVTVWVVSLCFAAIAAINPFPKLANLSRTEAAIVFSFFGHSILSGLILTWVLKECEWRKASLQSAETAPRECCRQASD